MSWLRGGYGEVTGWLRDGYAMVMGWLRNGYGMVIEWLRGVSRAVTGRLHSGNGAVRRA